MWKLTGIFGWYWKSIFQRNWSKYYTRITETSHTLKCHTNPGKLIYYSYKCLCCTIYRNHVFASDIGWIKFKELGAFMKILLNFPNEFGIPTRLGLIGFNVTCEQDCINIKFSLNEKNRYTSLHSNETIYPMM